MKNPLFASMLLVAAWSLTTAGRADDWPEFRGPGGQGHAESPDPPLHWTDTGAAIRWKLDLPGRGWSSPVVCGPTVWLTTAVETPGTAEQLRAAIERVGAPVPSPHVAGQVTLKVLGVDCTSGRLQHDVTLLQVDQPPVICSVNSYASPTPVAAAQRLYCDFGTLGTACLDLATAEVLWKQQLPIEHQVGPGSSPIVFERLLILTRDGCDRQYVTALDTASGQSVWRTQRPPLSTEVDVYRKAFSTPLIFTHDGRQQMVSVGAQWVVAYEPSNGRELWRVDTGGTYSNASRPVYGQGLIFVCTAYGGARVLAVRPDGHGDVTDTHVAWQLQRATPKRSSPLLVGDLLYLVSDNGIASCVRAATGEVCWTQRLAGPHSASPVCAAGRIYFFGEDGTTTVIHPGPEYQQLAENRVRGRIMASPAFVDDTILLRTDSALICVGPP
jgi:outer membrane protein assembly factor BamB